MTIKIAIPLVIPLLLLQACQEEPDPIPDTIDTYQSYYNYLLEPYPVQWEIDDEIIGTGHEYGIPAQAIISLDSVEQELHIPGLDMQLLFNRIQAIISLDSVEQELHIQTRDSESGLWLDSLSHTMHESGAYMIALLGSEEEPHLMCEPMDTRPPASGMIKLRFLHTGPVLGLVDIYIGGDLAENKVLSGVDYTFVTEYVEATEENLWEAVIVTPANTLPADSTILSYTVNTIFRTGWIYLCTIGHSENSIESSYQIQVDDQPVN